MNRTIKVFCKGDEQKAFAGSHRVIERYDAFVLVEVPAKGVAALARRYPVEDITAQYDIQLPERTISTSRPRIDANGKVHPHPAYKAASPLSAGPHHYLVQFIGPIKPAWLRGVAKAGGEARAPWTDFAYVVRLGGAAVKRVAALPFVRWLGHLPVRDRLAPSALGKLPRRPDSGERAAPLPRTRARPGVLTVQFFGPDDLRAARGQAKKLGLRVLAHEKGANVLVVETTGTTTARARQIDQLAHVHGVRSIQERVIPRTSNDVAAGIMNTTRSLGPSALGLSGAGETIGIADTGLDSGDPASIHPDFTGRVVAIKSYPITADYAQYITNPGANDGPADLDSGHGTHVAGSVLGDGRSSTGLSGVSGAVRGLAHRAKLVFQAVEQEMKWRDPTFVQKYGRYLLTGLPVDIRTLFSYAYGKGARIHSNSWGGGAPGAYESNSEQLDRFVWGHKTFCIVVAAGNDGTDADGDGRINPMSVSAPGTAKNCITIGACENRRPSFSPTYGTWWPNDFPAQPFKGDPMADNPDAVVAFSSRGPTQDGRIKPELVAPGTFILSTRSTRIALNNTAWAAFPPSRLYFHMGGTSMATPLTAGAVAVVREYLRKRVNISSPSAALLKAALIAGAKRLAGYAPAAEVADMHQGYGRVDLDAILAPAAPEVATFLDVTTGLQTGKSRTFPLKVKSGAARLRVVLVYTDYPGPALVNNLNLFARAPGGQTYVGNGKSGGVLSPDVTNNTEVIDIAKPAAGAWQLEVVASNVPHGPQPFAIVYLTTPA